MLHVALTGNVAAGKSTVADLFREWGATVIDADAIVHDLQRPGTPVFEAIVRRFGAGVVGSDGTLDRAALRRRILADPSDRKGLERIVHPAVEAERRRLMARRPNASIAVSDLPLLFEAMDPSGFDAVVLVDAPEPIRLARLVRERGLAPGEAEALIRAQLPAESKRSRSDYVIANRGTLGELRPRAEKVWRALLARAASRA